MTMDSHRPAPRSITLRFLAEPTDVNFGGKVHGGAVMKWIDQAGYACAVGWSGYYCVTVFVGGIRFYKPIFIGQVVEVTATVVHTGNSSIHIAIDVSATDPRTGTRKKTTRCLIVFVAVDGGGDTVQVPAWEPVTEEDLRLQKYAMRMAEMRKAQEDELALIGEGTALP
jgi:acyl-CoA hydrolase